MNDEDHLRATLLGLEDNLNIDFGEEALSGNEGLLPHQEDYEVEQQIENSKVKLRQQSVIGSSSSQSFAKGELAMIQMVLEEVDQVAKKRMKEGLSDFNFTVGLANSFFVAFTFGRYPQHMWLLYLVEALFFLPRKFFNMWTAKPLNQAFYYLDLCWMVNITAIFCVLGFVVSSLYSDLFPLSDSFRKEIFLMGVGLSCGPLLGANIVLPFIAFLFHDVNTMTGLFIHVLPATVMYTLMWHADEILETWPAVFKLNYLEDVQFYPDSGPLFLPGMGIGSIAGNAIAFYFLWFLLYILWMLWIGIDLPNENSKRRETPRYDTVFHSTMRGGLAVVMGKALWGRKKAESLRQMEQNDFERRDFFVYMLAHMCAAVGSTHCLASACFQSQAVHGCFLVLIHLLAIRRGSQRYTYYSTAMYGRSIRKQFADKMTESASEIRSKRE